jgi:hypothetical protein
MVERLGYDIQKEEEEISFDEERKKWTKEVRPYMLLVPCVVMTIGITMLSTSTPKLSGVKVGL